MDKVVCPNPFERISLWKQYSLLDFLGDREFISKVIAHYKETGEILKVPLPKPKQKK
jgi:hypothetical protein